jgi:hypothetical protein
MRSMVEGAPSRLVPWWLVPSTAFGGPPPLTGEERVGPLAQGGR